MKFPLFWANLSTKNKPWNRCVVHPLNQCSSWFLEECLSYVPPFQFGRQLRKPKFQNNQQINDLNKLHRNDCSIHTCELITMDKHGLLQIFDCDAVLLFVVVSIRYFTIVLLERFQRMQIEINIINPVSLVVVPRQNNWSNHCLQDRRLVLFHVSARWTVCVRELFQHRLLAQYTMCNINANHNAAFVLVNCCDITWPHFKINLQI